MTSTADNLLMDEDDPLSWNGFSPEQKQAVLDKHERALQRYVELYSSDPSFQARMARDPEYLSKFSPGFVHLW